MPNEQETTQLTPEVKHRLLCGCVEWSNGEFQICAEHERDEEDRCELREGEDRCPNRVTEEVEEPWTPGRFKQRVCASCAKSQIEAGYLPVLA